jgi:hypothetical protein
VVDGRLDRVKSGRGSRNDRTSATVAEVAAELGADVPFVHEGRPGTDDAYQRAKADNDHRRQDDPEAVRKRRQDRIGRVAAARAEGKSPRAIAAEEGVSEKRIRDDLVEAGAKGYAPEPDAVVGRDGKEYPATKPVSEPNGGPSGLAGITSPCPSGAACGATYSGGFRSRTAWARRS